MSRDFVNQTCTSYPGAEVSDPWGGGHDAWKVGGKLFALVGTSGDGLFAKCPDVETAEMLRDAGVALKPPYFHRSWVLVPFESADEAELAHRIRVSYEVIRARLPKKVQAALAPLD
jgi:predicted DNA-binding protein (MmcQ/YjbR family)